MTPTFDPAADLERRTAQLQARVEELDAFTYTVAHELRAPLQSISGFARAIELNDAGELSQQGRSRLRRVIAAAAQMERLLDDLLALARADRISLRKQPVAIDELVREVLRELRPAYPATRVIVSELPLVHADPALARQVLVNLVGNALKYSALAPDPLVQVALDSDGAFMVTDNGIGFPLAKAQSVFEPFHRVTCDPAYPGTGVGLAVVRRLLERHGGWIRAHSRDGGPTVFTFSFGD
ncbi:sensor histidine kinase [Ramlibacter sp. PS4R-6]|uniref:sensor histidine kinase n=1 Tax=Ramlibacter sp. PS4R-6 TaxID=3133438 RepID=UPI0030A9BCCA